MGHILDDKYWAAFLYYESVSLWLVLGCYRRSPQSGDTTRRRTCNRLPRTFLPFESTLKWTESYKPAFCYSGIPPYLLLLGLTLQPLLLASLVPPDDWLFLLTSIWASCRLLPQFCLYDNTLPNWIMGFSTTPNAMVKRPTVVYLQHSYLYRRVYAPEEALVLTCNM